MSEQLLHQAMQELAVRCDGARERDESGFNKPDSYLGKFMAAVPLELWSPEMRRSAWLMLKKYENQLHTYGIEYDAIPEPPEVEGFEYIHKSLVDFHAHHFVIGFDYDPALVTAVKRINGRDFNPADKTWLVPATSYEQVVELAQSQRFLMSQAAMDALNNIEFHCRHFTAVPSELLVEFHNGLFFVRFPKEAGDIREAIKAKVDGRRFDSNRKCWTAPHSSGRALADIAERFGFDSSVEAQEAFRTAPAANRVEADGNNFSVYFAYAPEMTEAVKKIDGRRFMDTPPHWHIPVTSAAKLARFLSRYEFEIAPEVQARLDTAVATVTANRDGSRAHDADVEVPGLGGELRPFQRAGVAYAVRNRRVLIADEMGCGKTIEALATIQATDGYPALIICPASLKLNWQREAHKWLPGKSVEVLDSQSISQYTADITIINYDILADGWQDKKKRVVNLATHAAAMKARGLTALVMDEAHYAKSRDAQRTAACLSLAEGVDVVLPLTGTPIMNRPAELIALLDIMGRLNDFGGFWQFATQYCNAHRTQWGLDLSGAANLVELNQKLREVCMVRRTKADVLKELPPKQRSEIALPITNRGEYGRAESNVIGWLAQQAQADKAFLDSIADLPADEQRKAKGQRANSAAEKARRAEQLVRINALKKLSAQGKMTAVVEWVESFLESGEKLVLFAHHIEVVKELAARFNAPTIMGETSVEKRQAAVDAFQNDPDCRLIVGNLAAMGVGLTLTAASNVAFVELGWTPAVMDQAEDRVHRIGQDSISVNAWYLLAEGTIDEQILALIERKRQIVTAVTDGVAGEDDAGILNELVDWLISREDGRE